MNVVQTAFLGRERIQTLVPWADVLAMYPEAELRPLATTGDGRLVIAWRSTRDSDWADGVFVGEHDCPPEGHRHGAP